MSLQQLDDLLSLWKTRLSAIAENLLELQCDSTYQSLTGTGGLQRADVTGETEIAVGPALRAMHLLFQQFGQLQSTLDRAEEIRRGLPSMFGSEAKLRQLEQLLFARSIEAEAIDVPLADRHLLSGPRVVHRFTAEELLGVMMGTFERVRDAVATVGQAWTEFAEGSERVDVEMAKLRSQTVMPSKVLAPALDAVEAQMATLRETVQRDPAGAVRCLHERVQPSLAAVQRGMLQAQHVCDRVKAARARWGSFEEVHRQAVAQAADAATKLMPSVPALAPVPEEKVTALQDWLGRLEARCEAGEWMAVGVGLSNWTAIVEACVAQDRAALASCAEQLASRGELRGRLNALKAKARAYGLGEASESSRLFESAETLLYARPLDLSRAAEAVAHYERCLRLARGSRDAQQSVGLR